MSVPILLAYATHYQLRPVTSETAKTEQKAASDTQYSWCTPFPVVNNHVDKSRDLWATCLPAEGGEVFTLNHLCR